MIVMKPKKIKFSITLQNVSASSKLPSNYYFKRWVQLALRDHCKTGEVHVRIVSTAESALLNKTYRHKNYPTNILSFPFEPPTGIKTPLLGDLVICAPVIIKEAKQQKKALLAHWAHIVMHGTLHLLGYDHIKAKEAAIMEKIEVNLLRELGYPNPYFEEK